MTQLYSTVLFNMTLHWLHVLKVQKCSFKRVSKFLISICHPSVFTSYSINTSKTFFFFFPGNFPCFITKNVFIKENEKSRGSSPPGERNTLHFVFSTRIDFRNKVSHLPGGEDPVYIFVFSYTNVLYDNAWKFPG